MKTTSTLLAGVSLLLLTVAPVQAYHVAIDTSALVSNTASGPFYLDFNLTDGGTLSNNTVTLSNFAFTGGAAAGTATISGGATGSLSSTITLDDSVFFGDIYQGFTQSTSGISFDVATTANPDGINTNDPTDQFSFTILDSGLNTITTSNTDGVLFTQPIDYALHDYGSFENSRPASGTGSYAGVSVTAVPEPSRALLLVGGLAGLVLRRRRRC